MKTNTDHLKYQLLFLFVHVRKINLKNKEKKIQIKQ